MQKINHFYVPIYHHEADLQLSCLLKTLMIVIFVSCMNKSQFGKRLASVCHVSVDDVPNVKFVSWIVLPMFLILWRRWYGLKSWNRRFSEVIRWICQEAWCGSCCHFHIDATTAMLFLLWLLFRQWLDFLWKHYIIHQHHSGMLSHGILSFFHETYLLYNSHS